ncbi:hypothetical protein CCMA1212_005909 [Trichoderma ghanense]|uniref:Uncharacterized protein n=1 Tax=Trichoderma ghanense TaxID=65468 RepID=A0ABY2H1Q0_9HYPO
MTNERRAACLVADGEGASRGCYNGAGKLYDMQRRKRAQPVKPEKKGAEDQDQDGGCWSADVMKTQTRIAGVRPRTSKRARICRQHLSLWTNPPASPLLSPHPSPERDKRQRTKANSNQNPSSMFPLRASHHPEPSEPFTNLTNRLPRHGTSWALSWPLKDGRRPAMRVLLPSSPPPPLDATPSPSAGIPARPFHTAITGRCLSTGSDWTGGGASWALNSTLWVDG